MFQKTAKTEINVSFKIKALTLFNNINIILLLFSDFVEKIGQAQAWWRTTEILVYFAIKNRDTKLWRDCINQITNIYMSTSICRC